MISESKYIYIYWCEENLFETPILEDLDLFTQTIQLTKRCNYPSQTYVIYICEKLNVWQVIFSS